VKTHVVVTVYRVPTSGRTIINTYGPYSRTKADSERRKILAQYASEALSGALTVQSSRIIDIDAMNVDATRRADAETTQNLGPALYSSTNVKTSKRGMIPTQGVTKVEGADFE